MKFELSFTSLVEKKKKKLNVEMCCEDIIERTARQMKA